MNWESKRPFPGESYFSDERNEFCSHVEADHRLAVLVLCEDDSFGPVCRFAVCRACADDEERRVSEQQECCDYCRQLVKRSDGREWRWYDFYAPQGDEPYFICFSCWESPKHKERMRRDAAERREEEEYFERSRLEYDSDVYGSSNEDD